MPLVNANVLLHAVNERAQAPVSPHPLTASQAAEAAQAWLDAPSTVTVEPTRRHLALVRGLLERAGTAGNLVGDAHLAALALEHGATMVSFDRDFARFEGIVLRWPVA